MVQCSEIWNARETFSWGTFSEYANIHNASCGVKRLRNRWDRSSQHVWFERVARSRASIFQEMRGGRTLDLKLEHLSWTGWLWGSAPLRSSSISSQRDLRLEAEGLCLSQGHPDRKAYSRYDVWLASALAFGLILGNEHLFSRSTKWRRAVRLVDALSCLPKALGVIIRFWKSGRGLSFF